MNTRAGMHTIVGMSLAIVTSTEAARITSNEPQYLESGDQVTTADATQRALRALGSEHAHERDAASAWLLRHSKVSRPALIAVVNSGRPIQVAIGALHLLGSIGQEADVPLLARVLNRADSTLIWHAAQALGQHRSSLAREALIVALTDTNAEIVGAAAVALAGRGDATVRTLVEQLLARPEEVVRYRAVYALQLLGVGPSTATLKEHYALEPSTEVRRLIDEALR